MKLALRDSVMLKYEELYILMHTLQLWSVPRGVKASDALTRAT